MDQATFVVLFIFIAFFIYITLKGSLPSYVKIFFG